MKTVIEAINELIANYALPEEVVSTLTDYVNAISGGTMGNNGRKQIGLVIKTVTGKTITVTGKVEYKAEYNCYYCAGGSYPAEIVIKIIKEE